MIFPARIDQARSITRGCPIEALAKVQHFIADDENILRVHVLQGRDERRIGCDQARPASASGRVRSLPMTRMWPDLVDSALRIVESQRHDLA